MHQFIPVGPTTGSSSRGIHSVRGRERIKNNHSNNLQISKLRYVSAKFLYLRQSTIQQEHYHNRYK